MTKKKAEQPTLFAGAPFAFADRFLQDHAGQIISEPRTAILELIANAYDAGATGIGIYWPTERGERFTITDNGIGAVLKNNGQKLFGDCKSLKSKTCR